jgi:hypothetical protein
MHSQLIHILARQHIADLHQAADHNRLVHTATTATSGHAVPAPGHAGAAPVPFLRWLRRRWLKRTRCSGALTRGRPAART